MVSLCPYICNNKTDYGYCKTTACINPAHRTMTFTSYDPIEIARQYAPKFDKPVVDVVEVVRCKDCVYYTPEVDDPHKSTCQRLWGGMTECNADSYCSDGVRKDKVGE